MLATPAAGQKYINFNCENVCHRQSNEPINQKIYIARGEGTRVRFVLLHILYKDDYVMKQFANIVGKTNIISWRDNRSFDRSSALNHGRNTNSFLGFNRVFFWEISAVRVEFSSQKGQDGIKAAINLSNVYIDNERRLSGTEEGTGLRSKINLGGCKKNK